MAVNSICSQIVNVFRTQIIDSTLHTKKDFFDRTTGPVSLQAVGIEQRNQAEQINKFIAIDSLTFDYIRHANALQRMLAYNVHRRDVHFIHKPEPTSQRYT